jgi:hypothetical protein
MHITGCAGVPPGEVEVEVQGVSTFPSTETTERVALHPQQNDDDPPDCTSDTSNFSTYENESIYSGSPAPSSPPETYLVVVFDVETDSLPERGNAALEAFHRVEVTVATAVCSYVTLEGRSNDAIVSQEAITDWRHVDPNGSPLKESPFKRIFDAFERATCIVAFNGLAFDMPALYKYYTRTERPKFFAHMRKVFDPFARIRAWTGGWPNLDGLLGANGFAAKTSNGAEAIAMWEDDSRHEELAAYCMQDSRALLNIVMHEQGLRIVAADATENDATSNPATTRRAFKRPYSVAHPPTDLLPIDVTSVRAYLAARCWCLNTNRA